VDTHLHRQVQLYGGSGRLGHFYAVIETVPKPVLLVLVGAVLMGGLFVFTRRGGESTQAIPAPSQTSQPSSPSADTPQAPAQQNAPQKERPVAAASRHGSPRRWMRRRPS
jgi:hypothetical protein